MTELRPIPGHPGYLAGDDGSIWSTKTSNAPRQMRTFPRDKSGHYGVNLTQGGKFRMWAVHVLVAVAWLGPRPSPRHSVLHGDDNPANNTHRNLSWGLPADNSAQMVARQRQAKGERIGISKLSADNVAEIRARLSRGEKGRAVAAAFGISPTSVCDIARGRTWRD